MFGFTVPEGCGAPAATLYVYDVTGRRIAEMEKPLDGAGEYAITWDLKAGGTSLAPGVYVYELEVGDYTAVRKMVVE